MHRIILSAVLIIFTMSSGQLFPQNKVKNSLPFAERKADYKLLFSGNSYAEIEFTPIYSSPSDFENAVHSSEDHGKPDLGSRYFPFVTPGNTGNRVDILDVSFEEINNTDIKPVPVPKKSNNKLEFKYEYKYDDNVYGTSSYYPKLNTDFFQDGIFRNKYFGMARINPVQYNPVTKTIKRIKSIKFRVSFGNSPIYSAKPNSRAEDDFMRDIAVNWVASKNWVTPEFNSTKRAINPSVLASGDFYKIEIKETGMYKIDKSFLARVGINVSSIDPRTIKIYGNGGAELPYMNSTLVPEDLVQNPIYVYGEQDGVFNDDDYIIFYGLSPHQWFTQAGVLYHKLNTYSNSNYYFITFGGANGMRMAENSSINIPNISPLASFYDKFFEEPEVNNLGTTGNLWVSQRIGYNESFSFNKQLPGYVQGSAVSGKIVLGNASSQDATFMLKDDNSNFLTYESVFGINGIFSHINLKTVFFQYPLNSGSASMNLKASLPNQLNYPSVSGYYDYLEVKYMRSLNSASNNLIRITSPDTIGTIEYQASPFNSSTVRVFKVTAYNEISILNPLSYTGGVVRFQDNSFLGSVKDFYVVGEDAYKTPSTISSKIANQNIRGISEGADFIIFTASDFIPAAQRLKAQREAPGEGNPNYLKTLVFELGQVYNEFSGGLLDPVAMRNMLKYAYNNWTRRPVYVLFLGDGSFDYKNIYNLNFKNYVPPIERTDQSMNEIASYNSDDFICDINENFQSPEAVRTDFSNGRFCVNSLSEANAVVDKIIQYESSSNIGSWKKEIMYVADDGWTTENNQGEEGSLHTDQCERLAEYHTPKDFEKEKIYIVTYPAIITPQGRRKPGANADIIKGWNEGRLLINYTGHGSTDLWAHEHVFVREESVPQMTNKNKYPLVTIASCDLARWDDPFIITAGEQLVYLNEAGAIGVVAATRPVYATYNETFNNALWDNLMFVKDTLNLPIRMGKAMFNVKNQLPSIGENDMKFCLVGDPSLRISIPQYFTSIDSINRKSIKFDTVTIQALQKMKISGRVLKTDSTFWNNFNGEIDIKVLDVNKNVTYIDFGRYFNFRVDGGTIFKGKTKVTNGLWEIEFIVPKDISYNNGNGQILGYFNNAVNEGSGYTNHFILNGIDTLTAKDTIGPDISIFMDSKSFRSGDIVNQNPKLIADFYDESGMNLTGTIGHKIEATINNDDNNKIDLTQFYNTTNGYKYGTIEYKFDNLPDGNYTLKITGWDTYNNFKDTYINFVVKSTSNLVVSNVYNYPNPMKDNTHFMFQHNFDVPVTAELYIYTVAGRKIQNITRTNLSDKNVSIEWDGKDADGDYIANGTYIYKLIVKTEDGSYSNVQTGKLAKLK